MLLRRILRQLLAALSGLVGLAVALWTVLPGELTQNIGPAEPSARLQVTMSVLLGVACLAFFNYFLQLRDDERLARSVRKVEQHLELMHDDRALIAETRERLARLPDIARKLTGFVGGYIVDIVETMLLNEHFEIQNG